ncbi:hypothetical protein FHR70_003724 [Microvirga lupini]|uniref:Uncharacterized protein n=1 Tax=Microvirga lupini TaxID=420324 RepID=A0A7W4VP05_9HYPH|nr:hypothetical protein [Microvirga lupini]MBB3020638.1 hypothetical protein [Microvirga lupini]
MVAWPVSLPIEVVQDGTGIVRLTPPPIRTDMEDGPGRARRRSTTTWSDVNVRLKLTHAEFLTFQAFHRDTLNHGASRFTMPVWKPGVSAPYPEKTVMLIDEPQVDDVIAWVYVTLPLRARDY